MEHENNRRPQPRRPEPSRRPAFSIDPPSGGGSSTTKYPHEFSIVTPHSYIDIKLKSSAPVLPSQAPFSDVADTNNGVTRDEHSDTAAGNDVTANDVPEPYQTTFATTRVDNGFDFFDKMFETTKFDNFFESTVDKDNDASTLFGKVDKPDVARSTPTFNTDDFMSTIPDTFNFKTEEKLSQPGVNFIKLFKSVMFQCS